MHTRRSTYALLFLGFIISILFFTLSAVQNRQEIRQRASAATTISLAPATKTVTVGDELTLSVDLDTGNEQIATASVTVKFDAAVFDPVSFTKEAMFSQTLAAPATTANSASIVVANPLTSPATGTGMVAKLTLRAKAAAENSRVEFENTTATTILDASTSAIANFNAASVTVKTVTAESVLSILPSSYSVNLDETFYVPIHIDTGTNHVTQAYVSVLYDETKLEAQSVDAGGFLTAVSADQIVSGRVEINLESDTDEGKMGEGALAVIAFKAIDTGDSSVVFAPESRLDGANTTLNVLKTRTGARVSVSEEAEPTPTPLGEGPCHKEKPAVIGSFDGWALNSTQVQLEWNKVPLADHYGIVYGTRQGVYLYGADNVGDTDSFTVSRLAPNTTYYFAVFAVNDCVNSGYSDPIAVVVPARPTSPANQNTPVPTPTPEPVKPGSALGEFRPLNPNNTSELALQFLSAKTARSVPSSLPELVIPSEEAPQQTGFLPTLTPVHVVVAAAIFLIIGGFTLLH